jgi:hypothetical protein
LADVATLPGLFSFRYQPLIHYQ